VDTNKQIIDSECKKEKLKWDESLFSAELLKAAMFNDMDTLERENIGITIGNSDYQ
jgi:hypothetical protein